MDRFEELEDRVLKFNLLQLPGQPQGMHMGTSYLVQDLISAVRDLRREIATTSGNAETPPESS